MTTIKVGGAAKRPSGFQQALAAKIFHWVNIISVFSMMGSGLQIYNANPVFGGRAGFHFPSALLLGGWLGGARHWHLFFMWFFGLNLLWYGIYIFVTKRWKNRYVGSNDVKAIRESSNIKRRNYAFHRIVYTSMIPVLLLALLTGLGMFKPVQFGWIAGLFGSWEALRIMHFISVPIFLTLTTLHSLMALKVGEWKLVRSMFT